MTIFVCRWQHY